MADGQGDECVLEVAIRAANDLGDHATGTVLLTLPRGRARRRRGS